MNDFEFQKMIDTIGVDGAEKLCKLHQEIAKILGLEGTKEFLENERVLSLIVELGRQRDSGKYGFGGDWWKNV